MREKVFIETIKDILNSQYIRDDCAYLKEFGIVITQDSLAEDVHFSRKFASPYQIGYKSVAVNISDVCASGAEPKYLTIALSLPNDINESFIKEFYEGAKISAGQAQIVGGDITGADKIHISIAAVGSDKGRRISSRSYAKPGQKILIAGNHGSSGAGLKMLMSGIKAPEKFINAHLMPRAQIEFSKNIASHIQKDYAMMDTSDGLMDALCAISYASGVMMDIEFENILHDADLEDFSDWKDLILFGGEDYGLVAVSDNDWGGTVIGEVKPGAGVRINYKNHSEFYTKEEAEKKMFKHFKEDI